MSDWLNPLRSQKAQAVDDHQHFVERGQRRKERHAEQLHDDHSMILNAVRNTEIETLLLQLAAQVVTGHPRYPNAYLHRTVDYGIEEELAYVKAYVDDPWQGYLWDAHGQRPIVRVLPAAPELPRGFYLTKICWHFHLFDSLASNYRVTHAVLTTLTPHGLEINAHGVRPLTHPAVQRALVQGIEHPWKIEMY